MEDPKPDQSEAPIDEFNDESDYEQIDEQSDVDLNNNPNYEPDNIPNDEPKRVKYLVFFAYIGRGLNGFQKQTDKTIKKFLRIKTVQDILEKTLASMRFLRFFMSTGSRTDAGVNAYRHPVILEIEDYGNVVIF